MDALMETAIYKYQLLRELKLIRVTRFRPDCFKFDPTQIANHTGRKGTAFVGYVTFLTDRLLYSTYSAPSLTNPGNHR